MLKLLAGVIEQPLQRPQQSNKQKARYSGKKKHPTRKIIVITQKV